MWDQTTELDPQCAVSSSSSSQECRLSSVCNSIESNVLFCFGTSLSCLKKMTAQTKAGDPSSDRVNSLSLLASEGQNTSPVVNYGNQFIPDEGLILLCLRNRW